MKNVTYYYWIQKSDYSSIEKENISESDAINAFFNYNWGKELNKYNENDKSKNCPPGIGIHDGFGKGNNNPSLLHICPLDKNYVFFNFHYPKEKKILGFIKYNSEEIYYKEKFPFNKVNELIKYFYNSDYEKIINF